MKKGRILPALLLSIIMMLVPNVLQADNAISHIRILGGELSNSAANLVTDTEEVLPRMKTLGLNTVLMPVYWELLEPVEDQMDFTLVDKSFCLIITQLLLYQFESVNNYSSNLFAPLTVWRKALRSCRDSWIKFRNTFMLSIFSCLA